MRNNTDMIKWGQSVSKEALCNPPKLPFCKGNHDPAMDGGLWLSENFNWYFCKIQTNACKADRYNNQIILGKVQRPHEIVF